MVNIESSTDGEDDEVSDDEDSEDSNCDDKIRDIKVKIKKSLGDAVQDSDDVRITTKLKLVEFVLKNVYLINLLLISNF